MTALEKGLAVGITVIGMLLVVSGIWSFVVAYVGMILLLTFYCYYSQEQ